MFELFFFSILSVVITTPFGFILFNQSNNTINLSNQLIYGTIVISFIALLINFFFPLNSTSNTLILILPLLIILKNPKTYFSLNFLRFVTFSSLIMFLLVAKSNIYRPDAILYHLPYTDILNNEKIIFGLSNLHFRYAHISIIQYFSAFFNNFIFGSKGIILAIAIIASATIINFLSYAINYIKLKNFNFHSFYIFFILIFIAYKMNRYGEYGNDAPTHFLFFFLISEIIQSFNNKNIKFCSNKLLLAIFIILNKITMAFAIFLPFIFLKKEQFWYICKNPKFYFSILFLALWLLKNIIVSGCVVYPISQLCFKNLEWTNINLTKKVSQENEAWTKAWPDFKNDNNISQEEYSSKFRWIKTWSNSHLKKIIKILVPYIIFLIAFYLLVDFKYKNKKVFNHNIHHKKIVTLFSLMVVFSIIWFLKVPVYRYGYSYFVSFFALFFAYICVYKYPIKENFYKFYRFCLIFFSIIFILKNTVKIFNPEDMNFTSFFPKIIFLEKSNIKKIQLNDFIYNESNNMCGYNYSPCTHYQKLKLKSKKYFNYTVIIPY